MSPALAVRGTPSTAYGSCLRLMPLAMVAGRGSSPRSRPRPELRRWRRFARLAFCRRGVAEQQSRGQWCAAKLARPGDRMILTIAFVFSSIAASTVRRVRGWRALPVARVLPNLRSLGRRTKACPGRSALWLLLLFASSSFLSVDTRVSSAGRAANERQSLRCPGRRLAHRAAARGASVPALPVLTKL